QHRLGERARLSLVFGPLDDLDDALDAKQGLGAGRRCAEARAHAFECGDNLLKRCPIDAHFGAARAALQAEREADAAALEPLGDCLAYARLEPIEPRRKAQADV